MQPFPFSLPPTEVMRIHRIVVAHNVSSRCRPFFKGGSGTLIFNSSLIGKDHYADTTSCQPFEAGWLDENQGFVHVLDDEFLPILLSTRDTITDVVHYLRWKEDLFLEAKRRGVRIYCCGEEYLLADYMLSMTDGRHGFTAPKEGNAIFLPEGDWVDFVTGPQRAAQVEANRVSYLWDHIIEVQQAYPGRHFAALGHP